MLIKCLLSVCYFAPLSNSLLTGFSVKQVSVKQVSVKQVSVNRPCVKQVSVKQVINHST